MANATTAHIVETLSQILDEASLAELPQLEAKHDHPRELLQELVRRKALTPFQAARLLHGKAAELTLGQYIILELVGEGGMGRVYKARQKHLGRIVALKVIRQECLDNPKVISRFQREIRAAGHLSHPHIVHAYDADQVGGTYYIAMEFIEGCDLARLVRQQGPLPVDQACDYIRQAAVGLQHAHERGLVHRDIKPANLLVARSSPKASSARLMRPSLDPTSGLHARPPRWGLIKILDLGLARWQDPVTGRTNTHLTMMGSVMGTPDFIAPEQARNSHNCDIRADLYSLGCTFYYLLSGRIPFVTGTLTEKLLQHQLDEPEPIVAVRRAGIVAHLRAKGQTKVSRRLLPVPDSVAAVVKKLMAKRPEDRYQTPEELVLALDAVIEGLRKPAEIKVEGPGDETEALEITPPPGHASASSDAPTVQEAAPAVPPPVARRPWPRWAKIAAGCAAGLLLLAMAAGQREGDTTSASPAAAPPSADVQAWQTLEREVRQQQLPAQQLREKLLDYRRRHPGKAAEAARLLGTLPSNLDSLDRAKIEKHLFAWMPDELVAVLGVPRPWLSWRGGHVVTFSPDGKHIAAASDERSLRVWDTAAMPIPYRVDVMASRITRVAAAADGQRLAIAGDDGVLKILDLPQRKVLHSFQASAEPVTALAFSPVSDFLASGGGDGVIRIWDAAGRLHNTIETNTSKILSLAFTPDGQYLAWGGINHEVHWAQLDGRSPDSWKFLGCTAAVKVLVFHPAGAALVCGGGEQPLRLCSWNGQKVTVQAVLDKHTGVVNDAAFSTDGDWLVSVGEDSRVIVWDARTGAVHKNWELRWPIAGVAFAPDSRHFVTANANGTLFVFRLPAAQ